MKALEKEEFLKSLSEEKRKYLEKMGVLDFVLNNPRSIKTKWIIDGMHYAMEFRRSRELKSKMKGK